MALIADCNVATAITDGWIDGSSLNAPMETKLKINDDGTVGDGTYEHPVFLSAVLTAEVFTATLVVQTAKGIGEHANRVQTVPVTYQRVSDVGLGHVLGTDFSDWAKMN